MTESMRFDWRRRIVRDRRLTHAQLRVLLELESYANADGTRAHPGAKLMSSNLGISERTVRLALSRGEELGLIVKTEGGRRGRARNHADVFALVEPQSSGIHEELPEPQGSTSRAATTGSFDTTTGSFDPDYRNPEVLTTRSFTPDPLTPDPSSSHLSNARESSAAITEERAEIEIDSDVDDADFAELLGGVPREPARPQDTPTVFGAEVDPALNPLAWIDQELPGGFMTGERSRARDLLASGSDYGSVRYAILNDRNARRPRGLRRARPYIDPPHAQEGA
ncbi:helix-turn-helix protein [Rhodococcus wratislaviensis]|uniref:Helix-turn-helix protein n=1 Tax=Rhodococcus wratislaviensis TaxID=44752 RepID=A0AB38FL60_RHOWR|nr:helix-turn-helix domain-containing protein [Rhodococcus wratislaviensis]REE74385.1 helix-turn-helix protein [Rhodococcus wratislaviensis]SPZ42078.1 Uncharacterised protein [Rhodococcus wratislaviensis]